MASPTIDGHATGQNQTNNVSATLTTTHANDIIIAVCTCELGTGAPSVSSVSGGGLTWAKRKAQKSGTANSTAVEIWWALAAAALSSTAITVNYASSYDDSVLIVFGVNGCNTSSPWDPNASVPDAWTSNSLATPTWTFSTSKPDDLLIIGWGGEWNGGSSLVPSGWTNLVNLENAGGSQFMSAGVGYESVSAVQSSATVTWGGQINGNPVAILDALTADASGGSTPKRPQQMIVT